MNQSSFTNDFNGNNFTVVIPDNPITLIESVNTNDKKDNYQGQAQKTYLKLKKAQKKIEEQKIQKNKQREIKRRKENKTMSKNKIINKIIPTNQLNPFNFESNELNDAADPIIIMSKNNLI